MVLRLVHSLSENVDCIEVDCNTLQYRPVGQGDTAREQSAEPATASAQKHQHRHRHDQAGTKKRGRGAAEENQCEVINLVSSDEVE